MPRRFALIVVGLLMAPNSAARAADYVLAFELREYRGRQAHATVEPVFGAKAVDVAGIWDALNELGFSMLADVEIVVAPHAKHRQQTKLGQRRLDVTINTGDLVEGSESSVIMLRYRDGDRASEVADSRYYGIVNRPFFLHSELAELRQDQSEVTLLWIATLKTAPAAGQQKGATGGASHRR